MGVAKYHIFDMLARRAVNVPVHLLECLEQHKQQWQREPLLVHLSTDQVYDGSRQLWREDDPCAPVNVYGTTKREAEQLIQVHFRDTYSMRGEHAPQLHALRRLEAVAGISFCNKRS
jgi:nucleoside-diphosphate-sugar epimerase